MAYAVNHMYKDATPSNAPEGSALYILNGVFDDLKAMIGNERGFDIFSEAGGDASKQYNIIGSIAIDDGSFVVALTRYDYTTGTNPVLLPGEIGVINRQGTYNKIIGGPLNFSLTRPLRFTYKRNLYNERTVVFTDNYNPPRLVNLDSPPVGPGEITASDVSELKLFRDYNVPSIEPESVQSGGSLKTGAYFIFSMYEDKDGNRSDVIEINNPIYITDSQRSEGYAQFSGSDGGELTNKSIVLNISNMDDRYRFLVLGAITVQNGVINYFTFAKVDTSGTSTNFRFVGNENTDSLPAERVLQQNAKFDRVGDITSTDKVLYLANVRRPDVVDFQKYANNIKIDYSLKSDNVDDVKDQRNGDSSKPLNSESYKNPIVVNTEGTFMPGEVYAAYIWFVLKDGSLSRAFHIPGRPPQEIDNSGKPYDTVVFNGSMENDTMDNVKQNAGPSSKDKDYLNNDQLIQNDIKFFRTRDTSDNSNATSKGYSNLAFWENENEYYPDNDDWDIYDENGKITGLPSNEKLRGNRVRHHKMPYFGDTQDKRFHTNSGELNNQEVRTISLVVSNLYIPNKVLGQVQEVRIGFAKRDTQNSTVVGQSLLFPSAYYTQHKTPDDPNVEKDYKPPAERSHPLTHTHTMSDGGNGYFYNPEPRIADDLGVYTDYNLNHTQRYFKMHPFDMLLEDNRIGAQPSFISTQDVYQYQLNPSDAGTIQNNNSTDYVYVEQVQSGNSGGERGSLIHIDLTLMSSLFFNKHYTSPNYNGATVFPSSIMNVWWSHKYEAANQFQKIHPIAGSSGYVDDNTVYPDYGNANSEKGFIFRLNLRSSQGGSFLDYHPYYFNRDVITQDHNVDIGGINQDNSPIFKLVNLHNYRTNIYSPFEEQQIFQAKINSVIDTPVSNGVVKTLYVAGGDCVLSDFSFRATTKELPKEIVDYDNIKPMYISVLYTFFCITTNNANYRQEGEESYEVFYPKLSNGGLTKKDFLEKSFDRSDPFIYNRDFTQVNDFNITPVRPKFDKTRNRFETIVARSEQDTLEKQYEPWRNFRAEDYYKLLDLSFGGIRNIDSMGERLIINLDSATFITYGQSQLNTSQESAYIGIGNIFRDRPKEIVPVETGYAGTQSPYSCTSTEFGYVFYDADKKVLYKAGDGAEELSEKGLRNFFYYNMRLHGAEQINKKLQDSSYDEPLELHEFDNPLFPVSGMGVTCGYDRFYNRLFITKRDFVVRSGASTLFADSEGKKISYTSDEIAEYTDGNMGLSYHSLLLIDGVLHQINSQLVPAPVSPFEIEDRSETISYSFRTKKWESHHSFVPALYQRHRNSLYSFQNEHSDTKHLEPMHEHNAGDFGVYYDSNNHPFEVAVPIKSKEGISFLLASIFLMTYVLNDDGSVDPQTTFDELIVSNSTQSSGIVQLNNLDSMRRIDRWFRINKFRDMVSKGSGFLDLGKTWEPDQSVIDQAKRWFEQQYFIDQYQILKFRYNNTNPAKAIYLQMIDAMTKTARR